MESGWSTQSIVSNSTAYHAPIDALPANPTSGLHDAATTATDTNVQLSVSRQRTFPGPFHPARQAGYTHIPNINDPDTQRDTPPDSFK